MLRASPGALSPTAPKAPKSHPKILRGRVSAPRPQPAAPRKPLGSLSCNKTGPHLQIVTWRDKRGQKGTKGDMETLPKFAQILGAPDVGVAPHPTAMGLVFLGVLGAAPGAIREIVNFTWVEKVALAAPHLSPKSSPDPNSAPKSYSAPKSFPAPKPSPKAALTLFPPWSSTQESGMDGLG